MKPTVTVNANVSWTVTQDAETRRFVAVCDPLQITIEGDTYRELLENVSDSLHLLLITSLKEGNLEAFLRERGWSIQGERHADEDVFFDVPVELVRQRALNDSTRRVH